MSRNSRKGAIPSDLGWLVDELDDIAERLRTLETPSGESLNSTVSKLQDLVSDIQETLDQYMASRYTNTQIDAKDQAVRDELQPQINDRALLNHGHDQSQISGTWTKGVSTGDPVFFVNAYNTDITWTRRTAWWGNDGRAGYASSSRRKKTAIKPAGEAELMRLLDVEPKTFRYRAEISRRTRLRINDGVDYIPAVELGLIAEELDDAGLGAFVYHDEDGNAEGVEYGMLTVALLAIVRNHERRISELEGK